MHDFKLQELRYFDAVAREGSFQAAAKVLNRSHPSVFAAVAQLEQRLGLTLLDRSGYRVGLTDAGRNFRERVKRVLRETDHLLAYANQLAQGKESVLRIVVGDLCPRPPIFAILTSFFADHHRTRLHVDYEAIGGPHERLMDGEADLVFHRSGSSLPSLEQINLGEVTLIPVVAPGFLPFPPDNEITPGRMRPFTQCIIRDTARRPSSESYFIVEGANQCSAPDHLMKRELILHGLAWGHLPSWLIEDELRSGKLVSIANPHLPPHSETITAARLREKPHGPVAEALWHALGDRQSKILNRSG